MLGKTEFAKLLVSVVMPVSRARNTGMGSFEASPPASEVETRMSKRSSHVEDISVSENTRSKSSSSGLI